MHDDPSFITESSLIFAVDFRFLGVNTAEAYQRARVSGISIMGNVTTVSGSVSSGKKPQIIEMEQVHTSCGASSSSSSADCSRTI